MRSNFPSLYTASPGMLAILALVLCVNSPEIRAEDENERGLLGIQGAPVEQLPGPAAMQMNAELEKNGITLKAGFFIAQIVPGSPADKAGLKAGDIIIGFEGKDYREDALGLSKAMMDLRPGRAAEVLLIREFKEEVRLQVVPVGEEAMNNLRRQAAPPAEEKPTGPLKFKTDFDADTVDELPGEWKVSRSGPGVKAAWKVVEAKKAVSGKRVLTIQEPRNRGDTLNLCLYDPSEYENFYVSVMIQPESKNHAGSAGVVYRAKDPKNFYACRLDFDTGRISVHKIVEGKSEMIKDAAVDLKGGGWHRLYLEKIGRRVLCYVDDKQLLDVKDGTHPEGKIGVFTVADAVMLFDDFQIMPQDKPTMIGGGRRGQTP
jgi:hypothetical protein